jgi:hypothetical protein
MDVKNNNNTIYSASKAKNIYLISIGLWEVLVTDWRAAFYLLASA